MGIARFAAQKRPSAAQLPDVATKELRELARLRARLQEDFASRLRQLHRAVDLGFPEFTRHVHTLESQLAAAILSRYPTAASFHGVSVKNLARIIYDGSHKIGEELARALIDEAVNSVGSHHSERFSGSPTIPFGNARLRKALWMVVLNAVRCNPWLRQYYERLRAAGKPGKVAVIAAMRKLLTAVWERGDSSQTLRAALAPGACSTRRGYEQGLINSKVSSAEDATNESVHQSGAK